MVTIIDMITIIIITITSIIVILLVLLPLLYSIDMYITCIIILLALMGRGFRFHRSRIISPLLELLQKPDTSKKQKAWKVRIRRLEAIHLESQSMLPGKSEYVALLPGSPTPRRSRRPGKSEHTVRWSA